VWLPATAVAEAESHASEAMGTTNGDAPCVRGAAVGMVVVMIIAATPFRPFGRNSARSTTRLVVCSKANEGYERVATLFFLRVIPGVRDDDAEVA
jgi:hypothetical protein